MAILLFYNLEYLHKIRRYIQSLLERYERSNADKIIGNLVCVFVYFLCAHTNVTEVPLRVSHTNVNKEVQSRIKRYVMVIHDTYQMILE